MKKINEIGIVKAQQIKFKRERDPKDVMSKKGSAVKKRLTPQANQRLGLTLRTQQSQGRLGGGSSASLKNRKYGLVASTNLDWSNKLVEMLIKR